MKYFKRDWDETTGEEITDSWGRSTYYFETDRQFNVLRQMQVFENGKTLKYDLEYVDDKFGGLAESLIEIDGFSEIDGENLNSFGENRFIKDFLK